MVITVDGRVELGIFLTKATEQTGANAPLSAVGATPRVSTAPGLNGSLNEISSTIGHARPEEELTILAGRWSAGNDRRNGIDDVGFAGAKRDTSTPGVHANDDGGGSGWGSSGEVGKSQSKKDSEVHLGKTE